MILKPRTYGLLGNKDVQNLSNSCNENKKKKKDNSKLTRKRIVLKGHRVDESDGNRFLMAIY